MALAEKYHSPLVDLPFTQARFERQSIEHDDPQHLQRILQRDATQVLTMVGNQAAFTSEGLLLQPSAGHVLGKDGEYIYLGYANGTDYVVALHRAQPIMGAVVTSWMDLRAAFNLLDPLQQHLLLIANGVVNWRLHYNYCPQCGSKVNPTTSGWVLKCATNGHELFPRTDPAVIVAILDDSDRILLGANTRWANRVYSVLAGFVEAGESLESAVRREVFEESGVRVGEAIYRGSQPWPMPRSLMLGYTAYAETIDLVPDGLEISDLRWFTREELASALEAGELQIPRGVSIAHALIKDWYGQDLPEITA